MDGNIPVSNWNRLSTEDNMFCSVRGNVAPNAAHTIGHTDPMATLSVAVYAICTTQSSYAYLAGIGKPGEWL